MEIEDGVDLVDDRVDDDLDGVAAVVLVVVAGVRCFLASDASDISRFAIEKFGVSLPPNRSRRDYFVQK